jgi:hypothetical protein
VLLGGLSVSCPPTHPSNAPIFSAVRNRRRVDGVLFRG